MDQLPEARHRKAAIIALPIDVYEEAKALAINFSSVCEQALHDAIRAEQGRRWAAENADFIKATNEFVEQNGLPLEDHRMF
jgi:antitoxin CcdA